MIYGAILENGEKYYTYLSRIFEAIHNTQNNYNWLITDCVCYPKIETTEQLFSQDYCWLSGNELTTIVKTEDFQWIWAVLSGFDKSISLEEILQYPLPYADGYTGFWENPISMQHPLASIEVVPWDSSLTLFISRQKDLVDTFIAAFPLSEDLSQYNAR